MFFRKTDMNQNNNNNSNGVFFLFAILLAIASPPETRGWNYNHRALFYYSKQRVISDNRLSSPVAFQTTTCRRAKKKSGSEEENDDNNNEEDGSSIYLGYGNVGTWEDEEGTTQHAYDDDDDENGVEEEEEEEEEDGTVDVNNMEDDSDDDDSDDDDDEDEDEDKDSNELMEEYDIWLEAVEKCIDDSNKKKRSLENELERTKGVEKTQQRAQLIVNNLYVFASSSSSSPGSPPPAPVTVNDWENDGIEVELTLDPKYGSASEEAEALFAQVRKLKRGSAVVETLLEETSSNVGFMEDILLDLDSIALGDDNNNIGEGMFRLVQDRLRRSAGRTNFQIPSSVAEYRQQQQQQKKKQQQQQRSSNNPRKQRKPKIGTPASNIRKFVSPDGYTILVGRNRRGNEYLSCNKAKGNDVWMHARGTPGAHVLILSKTGRGGKKITSDENEECMRMAANLAAFYSDARTEQKADITVAEPKHVLKPRNAPLGAVKLRQESMVVIGNPNDVPDELKEARDQSGFVNDEFYRSADQKAKHRARQNKNKKKNNKKQ